MGAFHVLVSRFAIGSISIRSQRCLEKLPQVRTRINLGKPDIVNYILTGVACNYAPRRGWGTNISLRSLSILGHREQETRPRSSMTATALLGPKTTYWIHTSGSNAMKNDLMVFMAEAKNENIPGRSRMRKYSPRLLYGQ